MASDFVENLQSAFVETRPLQDHAHARKGAKMARFQFHDLVMSAIAPSMSPVRNLAVAR